MRCDPPVIRVRTPTVVAVIALSWLGLLVHNLAELTVQARLGPTTVVPTAVYLLLAAGWMSPARAGRGLAAAGLGWLHAIGGGVLQTTLLIVLSQRRPGA